MTKFAIYNGLKLAPIFFNLTFPVALLALTVFGQTKTETDVRPLTVEKPIEREMKGGEAHSYSLALQAGQFLNIIVEQKGIDVVVALFDSDNTKVAEVDSPNGTQGPEPLSFIVEKTGIYRLNVRSLEKTAPAGYYEAKIVELRTATEKDKNKNAAQKLHAEATVLRLKGTIESLRTAIKKYEEALSFYRAAGDKQGEFATLGNIGLVYSSLGEKQKALEFYNQVLSLMKSSGDKLGEAKSLYNIAGIYSSLGDNQKTLEYLILALPLMKASGDVQSEANTINAIGSVYNLLGDTQNALEHFIQSLSLSKTAGYSLGEANALNNIGLMYSNLGEKQKALEYYSQSLPLTKAIGDKRGEANTLNNIGLLYSDLGEKQKALEYYSQILSLRKALNDKSGEVLVLNNIGVVYSDIGENQKALEYYNQALPVARAISDKVNEARILHNIGRVYYYLSDYQKALEYYNQALSLRKTVGDRRGEALTLNNIGSTYNELGEKLKALEYYNQALPLTRAVGNKLSEADTLEDVMLLWQYLKNSRFAAFYGKQSVNAYQELRSNIKGLDKELQKTFLKSIEKNYRNFANLLIVDKRLSEAQQILNTFKDQQYFDFNQNKQLVVIASTNRETELTATFNQKLENVVAAIRVTDDFKRILGRRSPTADEITQLKTLAEKQTIANEDYLAFLKQTETEFAKPLDEKDKVGEIPDTREMKTTLRNLNQQPGQKTVAVYTLVGENNFRALIVSPDGIKAVSSPIKGTELNDKALKLWGLLQSDSYDTTVLSKQIYDVVFAPIEKELPKDTTTIMWSLDGNLRYLPMAALFDGKHFLAERYNHVNFTRADSERLTRNVNPNWTGTGFGTSNAQTVELLGDKINFLALPGVTAELSEIFKQTNSKTGILTGEILPDAKFTKTSFLAALKRKRPLVHIASHFSFRPGDEARSFLLMGDGTAFTLNEMKAETKLFEGVDLLTLSACNTAAAQADANGREIDGFAELAQRLGAGAVMATLWSVSDASTPWLMRDFYATRQSQAGMTKAEALRKAQLELLGGTAKTKPLPDAEKGDQGNKIKIVITPDGKRDANDTTRAEIIYVAKTDAPPYKKDVKKPFAHPYYWSPFVLFGNWK